MAWQALKRLLELRGVILGFEDAQKLKVKTRVKGADADLVNYKEALQLLQPNLQQEDPIRANWILRDGARNANNSSALSRNSRVSYASLSPSRISLKSLSPRRDTAASPRVINPHAIAKIIPAD